MSSEFVRRSKKPPDEPEPKHPSPKEARKKPPNNRWVLGGMLFLMLISAILITLLAFSDDSSESNNSAQIIETSVAGTQTAIATMFPRSPTEAIVVVETPTSTFPSPPSPETIIITVTSAPTATSELATEAFPLPSGQNIPAGSTFPSSFLLDWGWVCSGDFTLTTRAGDTRTLYDDNSETGLIIILQRQSNATLFAGFGGYCRPYLNDKSHVEYRVTRNMFDSTDNCIDGCNSVLVIEVNVDGEEIRSRYLADASSVPTRTPFTWD